MKKSETILIGTLMSIFSFISIVATLIRYPKIVGLQGILMFWILFLALFMAFGVGMGILFEGIYK